MNVSETFSEFLENLIISNDEKISSRYKNITKAINQDFYEIHCVNKAKPDLECHGKCQLKKEMVLRAEY